MSDTGQQFSKYTPRAQQTLALARKEADRLNHNFVGTEHILLGLLKLNQGTAVTVLRQLQLDLDRVRGEIQKRIPPGPVAGLVGNVPYTPRVKTVLALAAKEASALGHSYIGTEHLLLGLLCEGEGVAHQVLVALGVQVEKTRELVLQVLDPNREAGIPKPITLIQPSPGTGASQVLEALNQFTPRAQQILGLARKEADQLGHPFVGTEHLLLGLLKLGQGLAVTVLNRLGLDLETLRAEIKNRVGPGPEHKMVGVMPYTPRVKKVLALAAKEAQALGHRYVGTEHILLGLLREGDGLAHDVLVKFGADCQKTRALILAELDQKTWLSSDLAEPAPPKPAEQSTSIETTKHYDVYCSERDKQVVYRNALFKSRRALLPRHPNDFLAEFLELQLEDGTTVFVARSSVIKFCEHGKTPKSEPISGADEKK